MFNPSGIYPGQQVQQLDGPRRLCHIDLVADAGYTNLICFSGNARGMSPTRGLANAIAGLKQILPHAEQRGVTLFMEGDVIRTIRDYGGFFGHYQTAGVPGRHEIDDTQELNYPAIARAILATGFDGYLGQEFIPSAASREARARSLEQAVRICDV